MATSILAKKSVCVITGPTKGLGRSIALLLSKELPTGSLFILLSRNQPLLDVIADEIMQVDGIHAVTAQFDQGASKQDIFDDILQDCLNRAGCVTSQFEQAILVNNAGSLEPLEFSRDLDQVDVVSSFFKMNLAGCVALTAKFLQVFNPTDVKSRFILNISSLGAIAPMKSWLLYCMAKAARDMMMKVVGAEEENVRTLNYAPGPLPTDMLNDARKHTKDTELRTWFQEQSRNKTLVECDDTVRKLITILKMNTFENGAHIDYYDEV